MTFHGENHHISWEQKEIEQVMSTKLLLFPKFQSVLAILNEKDEKGSDFALISILGGEPSISSTDLGLHLHL